MRGPPERAHEDSDCFRPASGGARGSPAGTGSLRPDASLDTLILAGDIGRHLLAREFVFREMTLSPVIYVPGNHEYYGLQNRVTVDGLWKALAAVHPDLHYLVAEGVEIDSVRFWGAPWYSDLWGLDDGWTQLEVHRGVNDFHHPFNGLGEWNLSTYVSSHHAQTARLEAQAGAVDVVITHWPPTRDAMHPKFEGDCLNPYFYNDHEELVRAVGARLWVSGHTHESYDYRIGVTRCVGNPSGYAPEHQDSELFRPTRIVEV